MVWWWWGVYGIEGFMGGPEFGIHYRKVRKWRKFQSLHIIFFSGETKIRQQIHQDPNRSVETYFLFFQEREKYVNKFIKILKHLRKLNNFNSYLALLSALDSAPIRRLEWQKTITDGLKEYCALIDSSSSFRAYRTALAEAHPPCIPYMWVI